MSDRYLMLDRNLKHSKCLHFIFCTVVNRLLAVESRVIAAYDGRVITYICSFYITHEKHLESNVTWFEGAF